MAEFYTWNLWLCYLLTFLIALGAITRTSAVIFSFYRHPRGRSWAVNILLELAVLFHFYIIALLHGQTIQGIYDSIFAPTAYAAARYVIFSAVVLLTATAAFLNKKPLPLLIVAVSGLTLPFMETLSGNHFAYIYTTVILFWLVHGIYKVLKWHRELGSGLSALSIKNAIDSLRTGIMFCEKNGFGLLSNIQMQRLMLDITGRPWRNGIKFYELIRAGEIGPRCQRAQFEDQNIIILPDGSAWIFTLADMAIDSKPYFQLAATDITERWKLTAELRTQRDNLLKRQNELNEAMANLLTLSRERQTQKIKMNTHDVLSERLTLMQQAVRHTKTPNQDLLRELSQGLLDELTASETAPSPQDELDTLRRTFASIGVEVQLDGQLPEEAGKGLLFAEIAREAVANAVRHGFASRVCLRFSDLDEGSRLTVTDNGRGSFSEIREGGGLTGMRRRLTQWGGELVVSRLPVFTVTATIPGKGR